MRISALEKYGLRCLLVLAKEGPDKQLSIAEIAEKEGLSIPYSSKLLSILRKAGLVQAARGRGGGFSITRRADDITLFEVLTALGGPLVEPHHCSKYAGNLKECVHIDRCSVHDVLDNLADYVEQFLNDTTLEDIIRADKTGYLKKADYKIILSKNSLQDKLTG
ncbi:MAG: Rrf2 family transcriptional regulator [candidate division Zixibacteria bacterium]|nr:Rrf2 family transcriptional regulator [candidate division Zixibacteria bacterium]MDD5427033.1 Rrf2 family transcriptional regulator [candidate division Zixibacteria bacterium]